MADDLVRDLAGVDAPRPLSPDLRARLEASLLGRDLPDELREDLLLTALRDVAGPRPLPARTYTRVEAALLRRRRDRLATALLGAAAALLVLVGSTAVLLSGGDEPGRPGVALPAPSRTAAPTPGGPSPGGPATPVPSPAVPAPSPSATVPGPAAPSPVPGAPHGEEPAGPPPPFTQPYAAPSAPRPAPLKPGPGEPSPSPAPRPKPKPPLVVAVRGANPGFTAYLRLLNEQGGVHGRRLVVGSSGAVAAVDLDAAGATGRPLLAGLLPTEASLRGDVFSFSSPVERQAHLAVDAVYPEAAPGEIAVVYGAGPAADAYEDALAEREVATVRESFVPGETAYPVVADAAFLAFGDTETARGWFRDARAAGFAPERGVAGIADLYDESLLPDLLPGTRVISPYLVRPGPEESALREGAGGLGADLAHGWVTAKALAVALWRTGADTPAETAAALHGLRGYDLRLFPPYRTRPGGNARVPEGVLLVVEEQGFVASGEFRTDLR